MPSLYTLLLWFHVLDYTAAVFADKVAGLRFAFLVRLYLMGAWFSVGVCVSL